MLMSPVRLLQLHPETDLKVVQGIKCVYSAVIRWEPYVHKKGTVQCHQFQIFGHGTATWRRDVWNVVKVMKQKNARKRQKINQRVPTTSVNILPARTNALSSWSTSIKHLLNQNRTLSRLLKKPSQVRKAQSRNAQKQSIQSSSPLQSETLWNSDPSIDKIQRLFGEAKKSHKLCKIDVVLAKLQKINQILPTWKNRSIKMNGNT